MRTLYSVSEGDESVSVCIQIRDTAPDVCHVNFTFDINLSTSNGGAGTILGSIIIQ